MFSQSNRKVDLCLSLLNQIKENLKEGDPAIEIASYQPLKEVELQLVGILLKQAIHKELKQIEKYDGVKDGRTLSAESGKLRTNKGKDADSTEASPKSTLSSYNQKSVSTEESKSPKSTAEQAPRSDQIKMNPRFTPCVDQNPLESANQACHEKVK